MEGMKGVREYMFTRPVIRTNPKTGKQTKSPRPCSEKIREINASRSIRAGMEMNVLLRSADPDEFLRLSRPEQRSAILLTREQADALAARNAKLEYENRTLKAENKSLRKTAEELDGKIEAVTKEMNELRRRLKAVLDYAGEQDRRRALAGIGVTDDGFDFEKNFASLELKADEVLRISGVLKAMKGSPLPSASLDRGKENLFEGIDF